jgi:8-oxo-dGTP pyrophosphatase MutT (NUDIX family)
VIAAARPSSAVCLLREGAGGAEVLMVRRGAGARFMGGAWVFPGGAVDRTDHDADASAALPGIPDAERPWLAAAVRELLEETGVWLGDPPFTLPVAERPHGAEVFADAVATGRLFAAGRLELLANWVTPTAVPVRFDARFYVAAVPADLEAEPDGAEVDAAEWVIPSAAIARADAGTFLLAFPTRKTLAQLADLGSVDAIVAHAASLTTVEAVQPRLRTVGSGVVEAVLPGEPGFDDLSDGPPGGDGSASLNEAATVQAPTGERIPELERRDPS